MGSAMVEAFVRKLSLGISISATAWMVLAAPVALGQVAVPQPAAAASNLTLTFDVATAKPSAPLDMTKLQADMRRAQLEQ